MSKQIMQMNVYKCLIISPGDLQKDRESVARAIERWNAQSAGSQQLIHAVRWETHSIPEYGERPQRILNRQIVNSCDFGIAIFWSRLGTPTEQYASGSIEEIEKLRGQGKTVLLYHCVRSIPQKQIDPPQQEALRDFLTSASQNAIVARYRTKSDLEIQVLGHLTFVVRSLQDAEAPLNLSHHGKIEAHEAVHIKTVFALPWGGATVDPSPLLGIQIQNHGTAPLYLASVYLTTTSQVTVALIRDFQGRAPDISSPIAPGDARQILIDFADLIRECENAGATPLRIVATDKLDRRFASDPDEMEVAVANCRSWLSREAE